MLDVYKRVVSPPLGGGYIRKYRYISLWYLLSPPPVAIGRRGGGVGYHLYILLNPPSP